MEQRLWRLTLLIAFLGFFVPASVAIYSWYQAGEALNSVTSNYQAMKEAGAACERDHSSYLCGEESRYREWFLSAVASQTAHLEQMKLSAQILLICPLLAFLVFFAGRWVITGQKPTWRRKVAQ